MSADGPDIAVLYRQYFPLLLRKCQRMLGCTAEAQDAAQETFTRLWQHRHELNEPVAVVAWLYTTATRVALDKLRSPRAHVQELPEMLDASAPPDRIASARVLLQRLRAALSPSDLELLVLARLDGLSQQEIALLLHTSERTIRRRLSALDDHLQRLGADHA